MLELDSTFTQWIGWIAAFFGFFALTRTTERSVKVWLLVHTMFYGFHFVFLGLPFAVAANVVAFIRISLSLVTRSWWAVLLLSFLSIFAGVAPMKGDESFWAYLPLAASVILCITLFRFKGHLFRAGLLLGSLFWLVHNVFAGSVGGTFLEAGMCVSTIIGWARTQGREELP